MELWSNPSCSKSTGARTALDAAGVPYRVRPYLEQPPTAEELIELLGRLGAQPWDICRTDEPAAVARGMADWPREQRDVARWVDAMVQAPELIQRPIVLLDDGSALVARTPDAVQEVVRRTRRD